LTENSSYGWKIVCQPLSLWYEWGYFELLDLLKGHCAWDHRCSKQNLESIWTNRICWKVQDGAYEKIQAIENKLIPWCKGHDYGITFAKYAAGCSLTQSPNDKGSMHSNLHRL